MEGSCTTIQESRSVGPYKSKPKQNTNQKKINQKNKKSRSVTIQIPKKPKSVKIQTPEPEVLLGGKNTSMPQCLVSVARHPDNCLYINSGVSVHTLFNRELLGGLIKLDQVIKVQAGGKIIHLSQI